MKGLGIGAEMMGYLVQNWGPAPAPAIGTSLYNLPNGEEDIRGPTNWESSRIYN